MLLSAFVGIATAFVMINVAGCFLCYWLGHRKGYTTGKREGFELGKRLSSEDVETRTVDLIESLFPRPQGLSHYFRRKKNDD